MPVQETPPRCWECGHSSANPELTATPRRQQFQAVVQLGWVLRCLKYTPRLVTTNDLCGGYRHRATMTLDDAR